MARQRASNFSSFEKNLLLVLMEEFGKIIEDKKTDSVTSEKKEQAWAALAEKFNGATGIKEARDKGQLKGCWKNLKAKAKTDKAEERRQMFMTGGGEYRDNIDPLTEKVSSLIPQQISPLSNPYDDDGALDRKDLGKYC